MAPDPDDGDDEWRFSLSDLEDREDDEAATSDASTDAETDDTDESDGISAGVAGKMDVQEELKAQEIDLENALFVVLGVLLALAILAGFLNLLP